MRVPTDHFQDGSGRVCWEAVSHGCKKITGWIMATTSTSAIIGYLGRNGECVGTKVRPKGFTTLAIESQLRKLAERGVLLRRQVILTDESNKKVWAYRLPHHKEKIKSFEPIPYCKVAHRRVTAKYPKPEPINGEPEWAYWLRTMPRKAA